jgi:hypothetical protein
MVPLSSQNPAKGPLVTPTWGGGFLLSDGQDRFRWSLTHSNLLVFTHNAISADRPDPSVQDVFDHVNATHQRSGKDQFYLDGEISRLELEWARGLPGRWEVGVLLPLIRASGGAFDDTIDDFHEAFGFSDAGRSSAPLADVGFILATEDGGFELDRGELGDVELGDLTLSVRYGLPDVGKKGHSEVGLFVELPTGETETLAGSGNVDVEVEVSMGWEFTHSRLTFGAGYAFLGNLDAAPDVTVEDSITLAIAWELRLRSRHRFITQLLHASSPFQELREGIAEATDLVAFGPRFALPRNWYVDVVVLEDFLNHKSDLDIGMTVNLTWLPGP